MSMFCALIGLLREKTPPALIWALPAAVPSASRLATETILTLPADVKVTPNWRSLAGLSRLMLPLPTVVMKRRPSPAPTVRAPPGAALCVTLVLSATTLKLKGTVPPSTSGTPGALATRKTTSPALTSNVPILLLAWLRSTESGTLNPGAASMVSALAVTTPTPAASCTMLLPEIDAARSDILLAVSGALMLIAALVSEMEFAELTAALVVMVFAPLATSDALLSVTGELMAMSAAASDRVEALPPAATVSGAVTLRPRCAASVTSPVASKVATVVALIWLPNPGNWLASRVRPTRSSPGVPSTLATNPMVSDVGSSSNWPVVPFGALRSAPPWKSSVPLPETSTCPPSPPLMPPRALARPAYVVVPSAQTTILPPSPLTVA